MKIKINYRVKKFYYHHNVLGVAYKRGMGRQGPIKENEIYTDPCRFYEDIMTSDKRHCDGEKCSLEDVFLHMQRDKDFSLDKFLSKRENTLNGLKSEKVRAEKISWKGLFLCVYFGSIVCSFLPWIYKDFTSNTPNLKGVLVAVSLLYSCFYAVQYRYDNAIIMFLDFYKLKKSNLPRNHMSFYKNCFNVDSLLFLAMHAPFLILLLPEKYNVSL